MTTPDTTTGISYRACLPLDWQYAADIPAGTAALWRQSNLALLQALATLESSAPEKDHADADPAILKAVERLEAKLDVALTLLARILSEHAQLPPELPVTLTVGSILWQAGQNLPTVDATIALRLYLSPRLPQPLQFSARVIPAERGLCVAELLDMDEEMEEWLTRTLFRYHRRELQARRHE